VGITWSQPDFIIDSVWGPATANPGQTVEVTVQARNIGSTITQTGSYVVLRMILSTDQTINLGDIYYMNFNMPKTDFTGGVVVGHTYTYTIPSTISSGTYYWEGISMPQTRIIGQKQMKTIMQNMEILLQFNLLNHRHQFQC